MAGPDVEPLQRTGADVELAKSDAAHPYSGDAGEEQRPAGRRVVAWKSRSKLSELAYSSSSGRISLGSGSRSTATVIERWLQQTWPKEPLVEQPFSRQHRSVTKTGTKL